MYFLKVLVVACIMAICSSLVAAAQSNSILEQQIVPNVCNYTTVETGLGMTNSSSCPLFAPTIAEINQNKGRPVITGVYDAVHTVSFRVQVGDVAYTLGSSAELTADGNVWVLDLGSLKKPLASGEYGILVEAIGDDAQTRRVESSVNIEQAGGGLQSGQTKLGSSENGSNLPDAPSPVPDSEQKPTEEPKIFTVAQGVFEDRGLPLFAAVLAAAGLFTFIALVRRRNLRSNWDEYYDIMHE